MNENVAKTRPKPTAFVKVNNRRLIHQQFKSSNLRRWINLALRAQFRPSSMAKLCSLSLRQMERLFAQHFNKTPSRWLRECRCRLAKQLISQGYSSRAVIAKLHFVDHAHLCHEFRKIYAMTPKAFEP